jgi:hypothetical protein
MTVKSKHVRVSRVGQKEASSALKSHLKYLQYRPRSEGQETRQDRHLFDKVCDQVDLREIHDVVMQEHVGDIYYHRMILSPAQNEPVEDWRVWTRAVLHDMENQIGKDVDWYAVQHHNTDDPHVHVVIRGTGIDHETGAPMPVTFTRQDFNAIRESGRGHSAYEHYHLIEETFRDLGQHDTLTQDIVAYEPEHSSARDDVH